MKWWIIVTCGIASCGCASVRPVQEHAVYRSGRLSAEQLEAAVDQNGFQTVVNLCGFQPSQKWYRDQRAVCNRLGVEMIDVNLSSSRPSREEVARLLETFHTAPRPILLESRSRFGDAGFAAGLYRIAILGESTRRARSELAPWQWRRVPVEQLRAQDEFLSNWQGEDAFFASYRVQPEPELTSVPLSSLGQSLSAPAPHSKPEEESKTNYRANPRKGKLTWKELDDATDGFLGQRGRRYTFQGVRHPEQAEVVSDYGAVLVSGPAPRGPVMIGYTRPSRAKPKSDSAPPQVRLGNPQSVAAN